MQVKDAKPGDVIETIICGSSGNVYKIAARQGNERVRAWKAFRGGETMLAPSNECRILGLEEIALMDYKF